jgi:tetratricopeptide (TPR) repeat protein
VGVADRPKLVAGSRIEELRRALGTMADGAARARLRVELAGLLRAHGDMPGALAELRRAAAEAPGGSGVRLALLSAAAALPATERAWLLSETSQIAKGETPAWTAAAGEAHFEAGQPAQAARIWLALSADNRAPLHRRRAAARRAEEIAAGGLPREHLAALRIRAALSSGSMRLGFLGRAMTLVNGESAERDTRLGLAAAWLEAGGPTARAEPLVDQAEKNGAAPEEVARLRREIDRRRSRRRLPAAAAPTGGRSAAPPAAPVPAAERDPLARALASARAGRGVLARRLAEQALRAQADSPALQARLGVIDAALRQGGHARQALLLRRAQLEGGEPAARATALEALAAEADAAGLPGLAISWRADLSGPAAPPPHPAIAGRAPTTPADLYLAAQRKLVQLPEGADPEPVLALLARAVAGHAGADAALALGDHLLRRTAAAAKAPAGAPASEVHLIDLLRAAFHAEDLPGRRVKLADRLAAALEADGDGAGALVLLERAIGGVPLEGAAALRRRRARLLRELGRVRELSAALAADADAFTGRDRLAALAERAQLLDTAGEPERALSERLVALGEFAGELAVLAAARRRLESTGRFEQSLRLATAAVEHVADRGEKLKLLRDIAVLSEKATRDLHVVSAAWLAVLQRDPDDVAAAAAAERLLVATSEWERYADLLSWNVARLGSGGAETAARRASLLWRLAELRRGRLGQDDEALRLYRALGAPGGGASPPPIPADATAGDTPPATAPGTIGAAALRGKPQRLLALHTARIAVAPSPADRARAHVDRGLILLEKLARSADAEVDLFRAMDLDPRNVEVMAALERVCERTGRWAELAQRLRHKAGGLAPAAAACLWFGVGRMAERQDDLAGAREAYERSVTLDPALREPLIGLRKLAVKRADWNEAARLLEIELGLLPPAGNESQTLLVELASIAGERLDESDRALELLERAGAATSNDPRTLDLFFRFSLQVQRPAAERRWEAAAQALDRLLATGEEVPDAADRYYRAGAAAEASGHPDEALFLYSRSYSRNSSYRPTLERLSLLCFGKGQWDNAWRATEALILRHRADMEGAEIAELLVRSTLCDVHIAQRLGAMTRLSSLGEPGSGTREVAESWAAMRIEPRLLAGIEGERRERVLRRLHEALALTDGRPHPSRKPAWEILGALAMVERRWGDAREALDLLAGEPSATPFERCGYLLAAGDIARHMQKDNETAERLYARARVIGGADHRLIGHGAEGAEVLALAHDVTGEIVRK